MKVILQVTDSDTSVTGLTNNPEVAEKIILDAWREVRFGEEELVKIVYEGIPLYTSRTKAEPEVDEFEYVDNDGNPINADGSEKSDTEIIIETPMYDYSSEYLWMIKDVDEDRVVNVSSDNLFLGDVHSLFEANESVVVSSL